jgi:hypothetical protein
MPLRRLIRLLFDHAIPAHAAIRFVAGRQRARVRRFDLRIDRETGCFAVDQIDVRNLVS